jgi:hypothetical protein
MSLRGTDCARLLIRATKRTAQLIDALSGEHLWADRFDGPLEDVFELQDQVALSVAGVGREARRKGASVLDVMPTGLV